MEIQWSLVLFTVLTGGAGWALGCVAVDEFTQKAKNDTNFIAAIVAIVLAAVGGIASVTHLSHPENMLAALSHPTSGIFTEELLVGLTAVFALVYVILLKRGAAASALTVALVLVFGKVLCAWACPFPWLQKFSAGRSAVQPSAPPPLQAVLATAPVAERHCLR